MVISCGAIANPSSRFEVLRRNRGCNVNTVIHGVRAKNFRIIRVCSGKAVFIGSWLTSTSETAGSKTNGPSWSNGGLWQKSRFWPRSGVVSIIRTRRFQEQP